MTRRERIAVFVIAAVGALTRVALVFRTDWQLTSRPYIEDAFYALSCARHIALGHGFTVDGLHPTNGVQPLICLLDSLCFLVTDDRWLAVRLTVVIAAVVQFAGAYLVARLIARLRTNDHSLGRALGGFFTAPVIGLTLYSFLAPFFVHHLNGLETGLYATLLIAVLDLHVVLERRGWNAIRAFVFGLALGVLVLARIDAVLLIAAFAVYHFWRYKLRGVGYAAAYGVGALFVSGPWWLYNYASFGSLMPISGQSETIGTPISQNILQTAAALFDMLTVGTYHNFYDWPASLTVISLLALSLVWFAGARQLARSGWSVAVSFSAPALLFASALIVYYTFFFSAPHFIARYLDPVRVMMVIVVALALPELALSFTGANRLHRVVRLSFYAAATVCVLFSCWRFQYDLLAQPNSDLYQVGRWSMRHPGRLGMMQSGTAGFVADSIVNLDGKVNADALEARRRGELGKYIAAERFEYLADWAPLVTPLVAAAAREGVRYERYDSIRYVIIYRRVAPPTATLTTVR